MKYFLQFFTLSLVLIVGTGTPVYTQEVRTQIAAFPGAEGCGSFSSGGRGGRVIEVINLNDSGPGSLREAIDAAGPRTVLFKISGTIKLNSVLTIKNGDITIAGQTAPGDGICLSNYSIFLEGDNIILRFIRSRMGDLAKFQDDAIHGLQGKNVIVDHCSFSWSIDETASFYGQIENLTVQWCLISESLNNSTHQKGEHGYGGIWGGIHSTFHHNLFAHHTSRTPRFNNGNRHHNDEYVDCVNNVMYNWGLNSTYGGEEGYHNLRFNYYKPGPATRKNVRNRILEPFDTTANWYVYGNFMEGSPKISAENWNGGVQGKYAEYNLKKRMLVPFPSAAVTIQTPQDAYTSILKNVGACVPKRDSLDARVLNETESGTAKYGKLWDGGGNGIIDSQNDVGGWPVLNSSPAPLDSDHDGMPDEWEEKNGLNPEDSSDRNRTNKDGYTMLEVYINSLVGQ
jgi:pectate lyase